MQDTQLVTGVKVFVANAGVDITDLKTETSVFFERLNGEIIVTIQETKPGGRTYRHSARLELDTFASVQQQLGL